MSETSHQWMLGGDLKPRAADFSQNIAFADHKIRFAVDHCRGKSVLDLGCVHHNPENYASQYWLHKALAAVSGSLEGLDLYEEGVEFLKDLGFSISVGNAEDFDLGRTFDVVVACDLIEHVEDLSGFLDSCDRHLAPGGKILISTPNPWHWRNTVKAALFGRVSVNPEHTLWMCPVTLQQLVSRHRMTMTSIRFGSRYLRDRLVPLPGGVKHTSFHAVVERSSS